MPEKLPTDQWIEAVRWHGDTLGVGLFVLWFSVLFFVFVGDTLIIVSPFLSYGGIANQNKMY